MTFDYTAADIAISRLVALTALVGNNWDRQNLREHRDALHDAKYEKSFFDIDPTNCAVAALEKIVPSREEFATATRFAAEMLFQLRGDGFATEKEMNTYRDDPLAFYEAVQEYVEKMPRFVGWTLTRHGIERR